MSTNNLLRTILNITYTDIIITQNRNKEFIEKNTNDSRVFKFDNVGMKYIKLLNSDLGHFINNENNYEYSITIYYF